MPIEPEFPALNWWLAQAGDRLVSAGSNASVTLKALNSCYSLLLKPLEVRPPGQPDGTETSVRMLLLSGAEVFVSSVMLAVMGRTESIAVQLRLQIECAGYAALIACDESAAEAWFNRHSEFSQAVARNQQPDATTIWSATKESRMLFSTGKWKAALHGTLKQPDIQARLAHNGAVDSDFYEFIAERYDQLISKGAHPNFMFVAKRLAAQNEDGGRIKFIPETAGPSSEAVDFELRQILKLGIALGVVAIAILSSFRSINYAELDNLVDLHPYTRP